ncbi:MAG: glycosyltransferase family 4 protein [Verrucomicrobia bacterium]|nr:glycosyltransferase family 4 protein [Verrucomicrobiota bacterium]
MSRFLFINQYYWPDEAATAQLLADLAEDLVRSGHKATVLCGSNHYASDVEISPGVSHHHDVCIERVGGSDLGWFHWAGRLADMLSFMWSARRRLLQMPRHDVVIAMTSPPLVGLLGAFFHSRHRTPLVLWMQDVYPEIAERLGALKNPVLRRFLHAAASRIYRSSARIVVVGQDMFETLKRREEAVGKLCVIRNWADPGLIQCGPVQQNPFRKDHGWRRERVLMYSGNLGVAHDQDTMLALISLLETEMPSLHFVLVGNSPRHKEFARKAPMMGVRRITCFPFQPRETLGEVLGAADAHLISQKTEAEGLLVPRKFYGAMMAGRPVIFIGPRGSEVGRRVVESQLGVVISPGQGAAGMRAAKRVLLMTQDEAWVVTYMRDWAETHASRVVRTRQFQELLEEVAAC